MNKKENYSIERTIIASSTLEGWKTVPHVCFNFTADVTDFLGAVEDYNKLCTKKISKTIFLLKVIIEGIKKAPKLNSTNHFNNFIGRGKTTLHDNIDINFPILLKNGQMVTVKLDNFENKSLEEMSDYFQHITNNIDYNDTKASLKNIAAKDTSIELRKGRLLKVIGRLFGAIIRKVSEQTEKKNYDKIKKKTLKDENFGKGTITVSNIGGLAKNKEINFTLLDIISPQSCAIGINPIKEELFNGEKKFRLSLTIAFDHKCLDFGDTIPFITEIESIFKNPESIIRNSKVKSPK